MIWGSKLLHFITFWNIKKKRTANNDTTLTTRTRNIRNVNKDSSARRKANRNYTFLFLTQTSLLVGRPKETAHFFSRLRSLPVFILRSIPTGVSQVRGRGAPRGGAAGGFLAGRHRNSWHQERRLLRAPAGQDGRIDGVLHNFGVLCCCFFCVHWHNKWFIFLLSAFRCDFS